MVWSFKVSSGKITQCFSAIAEPNNSTIFWHKFKPNFITKVHSEFFPRNLIFSKCLLVYFSVSIAGIICALHTAIFRAKQIKMRQTAFHSLVLIHSYLSTEFLEQHYIYEFGNYYLVHKSRH